MTDNDESTTSTTKYISIYTKIANVILFVLFCIIVGYVGYWIYEKVFAVSNTSLSPEEMLVTTTSTDVIDTPDMSVTDTLPPNPSLPKLSTPPIKPIENIRLDIVPVDQLPESTNVDAVQRSLEEILSKIKK
jgi:hypothetical protein